jgi:hypothetical protein
LIFFWPLLLTLATMGCQEGQEELERAVLLRQRGQKAEAFEVYEEILLAHPGTGASEEATLGLKALYAEHAKRVEPIDEATALRLNKAIIARWPGSSSAEEAGARLEALQAVIDDRKEREEADRTSCRTAEESNSRDAWKEYLSAHPVGICSKVAKERISQKIPGSQERTEFQTFVSRCEERHRECSRLESRFATLKAQRETKYLKSTFHQYLSYVLEKLVTINQEGEEYLATLEGQGIDVVELRSSLSDSCAPCSSGEESLREIDLCKEAERKNSETLWEAYRQAFPQGFCVPGGTAQAPPL